MEDSQVAAQIKRNVFRATIAMAINRQKLPRVIAIVGTNASGKSELGVALAAQFDGEIVSADSRQVYKGFPLAAGKPSAKDLMKVPHHLLDVVSIETIFSVADFQRSAYQEIDDIYNRGRVPFLVGGTGLYIRAVVEGYQLTNVGPDPKLRQRLEAFNNDDLWQYLQELAPAAAATIDSRNRRRLIRAIEITQAGNEYKTLHTNNPQYNVLQLGLTWPREQLRARIMDRLRRRLEAGMIAEVQDALDNGVSHERLEALGLEYRHISRYLRGSYVNYEAFVLELGHAIYRFAMRQNSWFRHEPSIIWLDISKDYQHEAADRVADFLHEEFS